MYEEGHRGFAFKSIVLKLLLIVVLIFLIMWLFPTKGFVKNIIDQKLNTNKNQVFNTNIETMKSAAISYYNGDRLPNKVGESKTLTLKEMVDQKLLVNFTDSNNKKCDLKKSYVKITKNKKDYSLKVNLACSDKKAYINSYISDPESASTVYSKKKLTDKNNSKEECEYVKANSNTTYTSWSSWTTNPVRKTDTREVQIKTEQIQTGSYVEQQGTTKHTQNPKKVTLSKNDQKYIVYVCPSDFDNGGSYNNFITCVKTVPNYVNKKAYKNITYYRYRDIKSAENNDQYKWGACNDDNLIKEGYKATGKTK